MADCMTQEDAMNMSNEQAVQILKPMRDMMIDQNGCPVSDAVFALDKAIMALEAQHWIPCSDRLPDSSDFVIVSVCDETGDTRYNYSTHGWITTDKEYWIVDNEINHYVVAWQPLPEPWRGEQT